MRPFKMPGFALYCSLLSISKYTKSHIWIRAHSIEKWTQTVPMCVCERETEAEREQTQPEPVNWWKLFWCISKGDVYSDNIHPVLWVRSLQHVELDESPSKDGKRPDDAHSHEHTEQDVVQNHGNKLPLLCSLERDKMRKGHQMLRGFLHLFWFSDYSGLLQFEFLANDDIFLKSHLKLLI